MAGAVCIRDSDWADTRSLTAEILTPKTHPGTSEPHRLPTYVMGHATRLQVMKTLEGQCGDQAGRLGSHWQLREPLA